MPLENRIPLSSSKPTYSLAQLLHRDATWKQGQTHASCPGLDRELPQNPGGQQASLYHRHQRLTSTIIHRCSLNINVEHHHDMDVGISARGCCHLRTGKPTSRVSTPESTPGGHPLASVYIMRGHRRTGTLFQRCSCCDNYSRMAKMKHEKSSSAASSSSASSLHLVRRSANRKQLQQIEKIENNPLDIPLPPSLLALTQLLFLPIWGVSGGRLLGLLGEDCLRFTMLWAAPGRLTLFSCLGGRLGLGLFVTSCYMEEVLGT